MTKLYCPKGHRKITIEDPFLTTETLSLGYKIVKNLSYIHCYECERPYFEIDCLTEPKKVKMVSLQDIVPPLKPASFLFESDSNSVEPQQIKSESQVAIERVIEALEGFTTIDHVRDLDIKVTLGDFVNLTKKLEEINKC